jgi:hypothetical protein
MAYTTPIFDRALSDITNRTAKGLFNVSDWQRIYDNSEAVNILVSDTIGITITFDALTPPTITTIPAVSDINSLLQNIERTRLASGLPAITGLVEIKYNWTAGTDQLAPTYLTVNSWEEVLDIIYYAIIRASTYWIPCGISTAGQARFWQHGFR